MKYAIFAVCVILLAIQSTLIEAGSRRREEKGHMATPEHQARISEVIARNLTEKCSKTIKRYGNPKSTIEENCTKLMKKNIVRFLSRKGCTEDDLDKLKNVIGCNGDNNTVQNQEDATAATAGISSVTQAVNAAIPTAISGSQAVNAATPTAVSGSQGANNVTEAGA